MLTPFTMTIDGRKLVASLVTLHICTGGVDMDGHVTVSLKLIVWNGDIHPVDTVVVVPRMYCMGLLT